MKLERTMEVWEYDGSFPGFLTIVYEAFERQQFPDTILTPETAVENLFAGEWIETDERMARKIFFRLQQRLIPENFQFIQDGFASTLVGKERYLLDAIEIGLETTDLLGNYLGNPSILALTKSIRALLNEAHYFVEFIRFEYVGQILYGKIAPKYYSLPYVCPHFAERFPLEKILIYDENHRWMAMIDQSKFSLLEDVDCPEFEENEDEQEIQDCWRTFLRSVTIKERINKKNQRTHLPLRYRGNMVDFK